MSTEVKRGLDRRRRDGLVLELVTAGEAMAVTISHCCKRHSIFHSWFDRKCRSSSRSSTRCQQIAKEVRRIFLRVRRLPFLHSSSHNNRERDVFPNPERWE